MPCGLSRLVQGLSLRVSKPSRPVNKAAVNLIDPVNYTNMDAVFMRFKTALALHQNVDALKKPNRN